MAALLFCTPATSRCAAGNGSGKHSQRLLSLQPADADPDRLMGKLVASSSSKSSSLKTLSQSSPFALPVFPSPLLLITHTPQTIIHFHVDVQNNQSIPLVQMEPQARRSCHFPPSETEPTHRSPCPNVGIHLEAQFPPCPRPLPFRLLPARSRIPRTRILGLSLMGMATHAEAMLEEMGFKPLPFEFRSVVQSYGRLGLFRDMLRVLEMMQDAGFAVNTTCANVLLSCSEMVSWLRKMRESGVDFSVQTFNAVLNSCPMLGSMMRDVVSLSLSVEALATKLEEESQSPNEALLVRELGKSSDFLEVLQ